MSPQTKMLLAILSLALGSFAIGTSEFAAMGLLHLYRPDLGVTEAQAGYVVSAYAVGVVVGAPISTILGAKLPRRRYLAGLIGIYGLMNLLAAVLPGYSALVTARFMAGLPHGGFLGVAMLFAADALPREKRALGVTQIMLGLTVANILGVPLAAILGDSLGWRWGFALPGLLALISAGLILRFAPRVGAPLDAKPLQELQALGNPSVILLLLVGALGGGGVFAVYTYLPSAMEATSLPPEWAIPVMLSVFGVGSTLGSLFSSKLTIRYGAMVAIFLMLIFMALTQGLASLAVGHWPSMVASSFIVGLGASVFVPLQTRLMDVAGNAQSMAAAMNHAAFNAANALGPWVAGMALTAEWGWRSSGLVGVGFSLCGLAMLAVVYAHMRATGDRG